MIGVGSLLLGGFLAVACAQRDASLVEGIVNDVIKPDDGLFSNVVEQFGIVSFSPTPLATTSVTPSVSPSASISPAASVFASSSPRASNSALPSPVSFPTSSSSTSPSSSVSPVAFPQGRRSSTPTASSSPASSSPAPSATSSDTPSPSPDACAQTTAITIPRLGYEYLGFRIQDGEGGLTLNIDSAAEFGGFEKGYECDNNDPRNYLYREENDGRETIALAMRDASDDGFLDSPKDLVLRAQRNSVSGQIEGERAIISIEAYTYNGEFSSVEDEYERFVAGSPSSVEKLPILTCCTPVESQNTACPPIPVATLRVSKNADASITLSATQINSQSC